MGEFDFLNNPDFGAPGGVRANQAALLNDLSMRGAQAELNMLPDKQAHLRAQTQQLQAQASKAPMEILKLWSEVGENVAQAGAKEYATQEAKALKDAMIKASQSGQFAVDADGKPVSNAKSITSIGMKLLAEGFAVPAEKLLNQANLMAGHDTSQDRLLFDKRRSEQELDLKVFERVGFATPWIKDQAGLEALNNDIFKMTGKQPPWAGLQYSPELVSKIERDSISYKDRTTLQMKEDAAIAAQRQRDIANSINTLRLQLDKTKLDWQKEKFERDKKAGVIAPAGASDVDAVIQLAIQQNPKLKGLTGSNAAAFDQFSRSVADEAKRIYKQHGGALTLEQARYKALTNNMDQLHVGSSWGSTTVEYESKGIGTQAVPMPDPEDPTKRVQGKWYNKGGQILRWDPKGDPKQPWTTE